MVENTSKFNLLFYNQYKNIENIKSCKNVIYYQTDIIHLIKYFMVFINFDETFLVIINTYRQILKTLILNK